VKNISPRTWTFIIIAISVFGLVLLASSLTGTNFLPGEAFSFRRAAPELTPPPGEGTEEAQTLLVILRALLIFAWALLPIYVVYLLLSKEARRRLIRDLLMISPILIILYLISTNAGEGGFLQELASGFGMEDEAAGEIAQAPPPPAFTEPAPWITTLTSLLLALALTLLVAGMVFLFWRRAREQRYLRPLRKVEQEAQAAIDAIEAGGDLREVILRCYYQMVHALGEYRNIHRNRDMTPHEFELLLHQRGMPREPVHQLTDLFEQVRYGGHKPGRQEERAAISSLSAIVSACQRTRGA
jgi:hypothetical protein